MSSASYTPSDIPPIGIDLGTSSSCAAIYRNGRIEEVPDADGKWVTPSCVAFTRDENTGEILNLVGHSAVELHNNRPEAKNVIFDAKRLIGKRASDVFNESNPDTEALRSLMEYWPFKVVPGAEDTLEILVRIEDDETGAIIFTETYTPLQISAAVLRRMREDTEDFLGVERGAVRRAVIARPAYFTHDQCVDTLKAARLAGFTDIVDESHFVSEPAAALLAHHVMEHDSSEMDQYRALVFDLGAGTFDVTVVEANGNVLSQLAVGGEPFPLGGRDFDHALFELVKRRLEAVFGEACLADPADRHQLLRECEQIKISLSDRPHIDLDSHLTEVLPNLPLATLSAPQRKQLLRLSRRDFEEACESLLKRIFAATQKTLDDTAVGSDPPKKIDKLILVGAATHMPMIRNRLERMFPNTPIDRRLDASRAVAFGAAIRAAKLFQVRDAPNIECIEVTPLSLGVSLWGNRFKPILPRNTRYGTKRRECFVTSENNQTSMSIDVYEGERKLANQNRYLNRMSIYGLPAGLPAGETTVEVVFELRPSGQLVVTVECAKNGASTTLTFDYKSVRASPDIQEQCIAEAERAVQSDQAEFDRLTKKYEMNKAISLVEHESANSQLLSAAEKEHKQAVCERYRRWLEANQEARGEVYDAKVAEFRTDCRKRPHQEAANDKDDDQGGEEGSEDESTK